MRFPINVVEVIFILSFWSAKSVGNSKLFLYFCPKDFLKHADERINRKNLRAKKNNLLLNFFRPRPLPVATAVISSQKATEVLWQMAI